MEKICKAVDCAKKVKSRGVCSMHYARWASGNLEVIPDPSRHRFAQDKCSVEVCTRVQKVKGMCDGHWQQLRRNGVAENRLIIPMVRGSLEKKYAHHVRKVSEDGCWGWEGSKYESGYAFIPHRGKNVSAHRYSYEQYVGRKVQPYEQIHHKCATRECTNPLHLQPVTAKENMAEMFQRNYYIKELERLRGLLEVNGIAY